jgi:hypothetical protein
VVFSEKLPSGSLLIMAGDTRKNFRHEVPKEPGITLPRINLTFRRIEHITAVRRKIEQWLHLFFALDYCIIYAEINSVALRSILIQQRSAIPISTFPAKLT